MADGLSLLPRDIFETGILPMISYGDVVRLSGVSKQWKHLSTETPILNFHWKDFQRQQDMEINDIISRILFERKTPIKSLDINVAYGNPYTMNINHWVMCAAANQVECLSIRICYRARAHNIVEGSFAIDLSASPYKRGLTIDLTPSLCLCENLISLKIMFFDLPRIPRCFAGFQNPETLCYADNPYLNASRINQFLEACPNLQNLVMRNCKRFTAFNLEAANLKYLYLGFRAPILSFRLIAPNLAGVTLVNPWPCTHVALLDSSIIKERIKTLTIQNYASCDALLPSFAVLNSFPDLQILAIHGQCFQEMTKDIDIAEAKFPNLREVRLHISTTKIREHFNFIIFLAKNNPSLPIKVFLPKRRRVLQKLHDLRLGFPTISMAFYEEGSTMGQHFCQLCDYYMIWFDVLSIMVMACGLYCQLSCRHVLSSMV